MKRFSPTVLIVSCLAALLPFTATCSRRAAGPPITILCLGDSLTEKKSGYPPHLQRLLNEEGISAEVSVLARPGNNSREFRRFLIRGQSDPLRGLRPDFVFLMLGTNDVRCDGDRTPIDQYKRNMEEIITVVRRVGPRRVFIAAVPPIVLEEDMPFNAESVQRVPREINPAVRELARRFALEVVDMYALFAADRTELPGIHPSERGYAMMAERFLRALRPWLPGKN